MSFYSSQFGNKSSRYCSSDLYGSNLSSVYADGPPPLDDTTEEDDEEIVFRDKNPTKLPSDSKFNNEKIGNVSSQSQFTPWSKNETSQQDTGDDNFGDFSGFADFSSAFGNKNESKSQTDSWFKNGDNDQSTVTNFKNNYSNNQGQNRSEKSTSKDDDFGCFSGDDSDLDDFCGFTSNSAITGKSSEDAYSKDSKFHESFENKDKLTTKTNNIFKNDKTLHGSNEHITASMNQSQSFKLSDNQSDAKTSNFSSDDEFDEFCSSERDSPLDMNGEAVSPINHEKMPHSAQKLVSNIHSDKKSTCFSDDDDDFGDFNSSEFDDECGETAKSPDLIRNSGHTNSSSKRDTFKDNSNSDIQNYNVSEINNGQLSDVQSNRDKQDRRTTSRGVGEIESKCDYGNWEETQTLESKNDKVEISPSQEPLELTENDQSDEINIEKDNDSTITSVNSKHFTSIDQSDRNSSQDNDDDDDFGAFSTASPDMTIAKEEESRELSNKNDDDDFGDFGAFGAAVQPNGEKHTSIIVGDDNEFGDFKADDDDDDDFGAFSTNSPAMNIAKEEVSRELSNKDDDDDDEFGNFKAVSSPPELNTQGDDDDDDRFGDFNVASKPSDPNLQVDDENDFGDFGVVSQAIKEKPQNYEDEFGDFGVVGLSVKEKVQNDDDDDDDFGDFGVASTPCEQNISTSNDGNDYGVASTSKEAKLQTDDDDDFGDFGVVVPSTKEKVQDNDDDDFGDFGVVCPSDEQTSKDNFDDFGDFSEVRKPDIKENKNQISSKSSSEQGKLSAPLNDSGNEFGQFDSAPSNTPNGTFAVSKSSDNISEGFADFSSAVQKSESISFNTTKVSESCSVTEFQHVSHKVTGNTIAINPQKNATIDSISTPFKQSFTNNVINIENNIIVQLIEYEIQSERSRIWQQLRTAERDGSLRFEWVLSEHQIKMLEGLSMLPVKIQTSYSFKPGGQVPTPLFASSMGLLEPVKGIITPFHHMEDIDPSQDPFGAPPEVGLQDLGFEKRNKKETLPLQNVLEAKDNISDTISVSSSLDLDFLAPSNANGESTKTEGRGLFEDDLLGLGMQFTESSASPKVFEGRDQKNSFKFNSAALSVATDEGHLSEKAQKIVKDFEDLSFMMSKVLMFPLKSKE